MKLNVEYTAANLEFKSIELIATEVARQMAKQVEMSEISDDESRFDYDNFEVFFEDGIVFYLTGSIQNNYIPTPQEDDGSRYELTGTDVYIKEIGATIEGEEVECKINDKKLEDLIPLIEKELKNLL